MDMEGNRHVDSRQINIVLVPLDVIWH
jgi:hypothetical protein